MITLLKVRNYKSLENVELPLGPLHVLVGPNYSDGRFIEAGNGQTRDVYNPAKGEVMAEVPEVAAADVERAIAAARRGANLTKANGRILRRRSAAKFCSKSPPRFARTKMNWRVWKR